MDKSRFLELVRSYHEERGWDPETGKPKEETLLRLGLEQQAKDIAQIEIPVKVQDVVLRYKETTAQKKKK